MKISSEETVRHKITIELDQTEACALLEDLNFIYYHCNEEKEQLELIILDSFRDELRKLLDELNIV